MTKQIPGTNDRDYKKNIQNTKGGNDYAIRNELIQSEKRLLFHGSLTGISGNIQCDKNKGLCDYGNGFYTGESIEQAENRVCNSSMPIIYGFEYDP